jgi:hypothetical protein
VSQNTSQAIGNVHVICCQKLLQLLLMCAVVPPQMGMLPPSLLLVKFEPFMPLQMWMLLL